VWEIKTIGTQIVSQPQVIQGGIQQSTQVLPSQIINDSTQKFV
jgi:hypothetical protein